ncbi:MAG: hypothetical protein MJ168_08070 [Clostridia bacterium]|nr:hypothetical protein [Clostridia bacterium]
MAVIDIIKRELRENQSPYFDDNDINYYLSKNNGDIEATVYEMLLIKAEDSTLEMSGLTSADTSAYFRRLASKHRPFNTGILSGGA